MTSLVAEQSSYGMREELEPNRQGRIPGEQGSSFLRLQIRDGLKIERDGVLQGLVVSFFERVEGHSPELRELSAWKLRSLKFILF